MVRGLIEYQHVRPIERQPAEDEPRCFTARQGAHLLLTIVPREEHESHLPSDETTIPAGAEPPEPLLGRFLGVLEQLLVVLLEVARMRLVSPLDLPLVCLEIAHQNLQQSGLADSVRPHDRQAVASLHAQIHASKDLVVTEGLADA